MFHLKIVFITAELVKESVEKSNRELEREIMEELLKSVIPWVKEVEKVTVLEAHFRG
jgi:hypothetical protein